MKMLAIIHANDGSDVRIGKTCRSLSGMGYRVHFIGWDRREGGRRDIELGGASAHVMRRPTPHGRFTAAGQLAFYRHVVATLWRLRPRVVCCVNEDACLGLLPWRGVLFDHLVCDIFDGLVDRHSSRPGPVRWLLRAVSEVVRWRSDRLIATDQARFQRLGRFGRKAVIVENVPETPPAELAMRMPEGPGRLYVAGSLSRGRGIEQALEAARRAGVRIVSAGWPYDAAAERLVTDPAVEFHGIVTAGRSLELAASCDAVLAFYAPTSVNNLYASPNKLYDALSVGRPVIVNREIRPARWVERQEVGWTCGYEDVCELERILASLASRRGELPAFAARARALFLAGPTWEKMAGRLDELYRGLKERSA